MRLEIPVEVEFEDVTGMIEEIKKLQTYKLWEGDDMLLVDRDDVADVLTKHLRAKQTVTTTWLGDYCPYECENCGYHVDSKTPYCPMCGRKASNYGI